MHVWPAKSLPSHCSVPSTMLLPHAGPPVEVDAPPVPVIPPLPAAELPPGPPLPVVAPPVPAEPLLLADGLPLEPLLVPVVLPLLAVGDPLPALVAAPPVPLAASPCSPCAH